LKLVFSGRNSIVDSLLPPLLFIIINAIFGFMPALWVSLAGSLCFTVLRLVRRQPLWYALGGFGAVLLAFGLAFFLDRAEAYFLPTLINGALTVVVLAVSLLVKRPAVAFTSFLTRRWPLDWYWHPQVRPAYSEVTLFWILFFGLKLGFQYAFYTRGMVDALAVFNLASGWPALIVLLMGSYVYGQKKLKRLKGPSVEEFKDGTPPPWQGQRRGF
jgi:hypothetical protein